MDGRTLARVSTVVAVGLVTLLIAAVGTIAFVAEINETWEWYFLMERAIALATPLVLVLVGLSVVACFCLVATTTGE